MNKLALVFLLIIVLSIVSGCISGGGETAAPETTQAPTGVPTTTPSPTTSDNAQTGTINGTCYFDFETGKSTSDYDCDVWWEQENDIERNLVALGSAYFVMSDIDEFDSIGLEEATTMIENRPHLTIITGDDNDANEVPEGTIFLCVTDEGNVYKVMVVEYGYSMGVLYEIIT